MRRPIKRNLDDEEDTIEVPVARLRQLEKDSVLLRAVRDAGYLEGAAGHAVMTIAHREYNYHRM